MLLTVETKATDGGKVGQVRVHADAILYAPAGASHAHSAYGYNTSRYSHPARLFAMSLIGSEQSLRAIAAGCAMDGDDRCNRVELEISGPNAKVRAKWDGPWRCNAQGLVSGVMHMVALPEVSLTQDAAGKTSTHVIIADRSREAAMEADFRAQGEDEATALSRAVRANLYNSIYERLMLAFTTPLLPLNLPGMSAVEQATAEHWRDTIVGEILKESSYWEALKPHPDQQNDAWLTAGLLTIHEDDVDALVCSLVKRGRVRIPAAAIAS